MLRNTRESWGSVAKVLHWGIAVLIFIQLPLGWLADEWPLSPIKLGLFAAHKSNGLLILALVIVRLSWRMTNVTPALPATLRPWEHHAARANHALIYVLLVGLPVSGWVINSAANVPFRVFGWFPLPAIVSPSERVEEAAEAFHVGLVLTLFLALLLHIGAALRHHYVKRDDVLKRMLPGKRS